MTNGERIQTILDVDRDCTEVHGENGTMTFTVTQDFWNAEYQEPTPNNDLGVELISREDVLQTLLDYDYANENALVLKDIEALPSVTPQEPKTGHWIIKDGKEQGYDIGGVKTWYIQIMCSECGFIKTAIEGHIGQYHYCPNCGSRNEVKNDNSREE